jgi:hypothetical protein
MQPTYSIRCTGPTREVLSKLALKLWDENEEAMRAAGHNRPSKQMAIDYCVYCAVSEKERRKLKMKVEQNEYYQMIKKAAEV